MVWVTVNLPDLPTHHWGGLVQFDKAIPWWWAGVNGFE